MTAEEIRGLRSSLVLPDPVSHNAFAYPDVFRGWLGTTRIYIAPSNSLVSSHA